MRRLLYIDTSYTFQTIKDLGLDNVLRVRHLGGYWDKVWSVHPVDRHPKMKPGESVFGRPEHYRVDENHVFISGSFGRFGWMAKFPALNAIMSLFSLLIELLRLARREEIDVVRAGDPLFTGFLGLIVARLSGAKFVVRINGDHDRIRRDSGRSIKPNLIRNISAEERIERIVLSRADAVILYTNSHLSYALSKGSTGDRCHLIRYGELINKIHLVPHGEREELPEEALVEKLEQRPWLLHIGRLLEIKHVEDCFDVLEILADKGSNAGLCLVGDGALKEHLKKRVKDAGLGDRILFLGNRDQDFLSRLIPYCAVVLSPLTGRALAEAALGAASIVAYDLDWQSEIVFDGKTGILVPARDVKAMADGALRLLSDRGLASSMGEAARAQALEMFDPEVQTRREIKLYEQLGCTE